MEPTLNPTTPVFFSGLYGDTIRLLHEAQEYFSVYGPQDQEEATPVEKLVYSSEMSRVTLRLSAVMAWLMARFATHTGKITPEEAAKRFRLSFQDICSQELPEMHHVLPEYMCELMARSLDLYRRCARLDELVEKTTLH